jgi:hypothetical protein
MKKRKYKFFKRLKNLFCKKKKEIKKPELVCVICNKQIKEKEPAHIGWILLFDKQKGSSTYVQAPTHTFCMQNYKPPQQEATS